MAMQPMASQNVNPLSGMPPEAVEALMQPDEDIQMVLVARLSNMSPQELQMLDTAITPEVADVLVRLLPELKELVDQISATSGNQMAEGGEGQMGALGGI